ncbi:ABC transporter permease [Kocuria indica]|uniref:ABC transporter permease n=1 Tax=Kocuria TaxID=57493 RepID=UPI0007EBA2A5|nr:MULTISPECIES: ABC transporter permease [Kocuria]MCG7431450.1 ABC transporter permease [Kocuria indica]MCT2360424.1 ABC transporter permease [Kocuria marina]OBA49080.1 sugar ABC transporter permease [Kocuria sp. ICS0012]
MEMQAPATQLRPPGQDRGLRDVFANRFLLKLIVDKEIQIRYRGTVLGLLWSYLKPGVQFLVFYIAMGVFLDLNRGIENFAVYLFSGIVVMNLFGEVFGNASRSVVANGGLLKKIYLPRQLFPVSNLLVAFIHFVPQLAILLLACLVTGWRPDLKQLLAVVVGTLIIALFSLSLGMLFTTFNVFFRDAENIVDLIVMVSTWASPVLYMWTMVREKLWDWVYYVYMVNPLTVAVELFHYGFWFPTTDNPQIWHVPPHLMTGWTPLAIVTSLILFVIADRLFRSQEGNFAQEL